MGHRFCYLLLIALPILSGCGDARTSESPGSQEQQTDVKPSPGNAAAHVTTGPPPAASTVAPPAGKELLPEKPPIDPAEAEAQTLVAQLLAASADARSSIAAQLKKLGDKAVPALLASLIDQDDQRPVVLNLLHAHVGYHGPSDGTSFAVAAASASPRRDAVVPPYALQSVLLATTHPNDSIQRGAFRYLRQLGYVGEDRIAIADACWTALQFFPDIQVRAEASRLRREQTDLAIAMIERDRSAFEQPLLPLTALWLAHLGSAAVRRGLNEPQISLRTANAMLATHKFDLQQARTAAADARRDYFDQIQADVIEFAREKGRALHPYRPNYLRPAVPHGVNLPALNKYLAIRDRMAQEVDEPRIEAEAERSKNSHENKARAALLAIEVIELNRDARLLAAAAAETDIDPDQLDIPSIVDHPLYKLALQLAGRHKLQEEHAQANFWGNEAMAGYRDWPSGLHLGYLNAVYLVAETDAKLGEREKALANIKLATDALLVIGDYNDIAEQRVDARKARAKMEAFRATILDQLGRREEAEFYRREHSRFLEERPDEAAVARALQLAETGNGAYELGEYDRAVELMLAARQVLDPPDRDTLPPLVELHLRLGHALREIGKPAASLCVAMHGCMLARREYGPEARANASMILMLAAAQRDIGRLDEAESNIQLSMTTYREGSRSDTPPDAMHLTSCDHHLGVLRVKQGRIDEGTTLLQQALAARTERFGDQHRLTRQTQKALDEIMASP